MIQRYNFGVAMVTFNARQFMFKNFKIFLLF